MYFLNFLILYLCVKTDGWRIILTLLQIKYNIRVNYDYITTKGNLSPLNLCPWGVLVVDDDRGAGDLVPLQLQAQTTPASSSPWTTTTNTLIHFGSGKSGKSASTRSTVCIPLIYLIIQVIADQLISI